MEEVLFTYKGISQLTYLLVGLQTISRDSNRVRDLHIEDALDTGTTLTLNLLHLLYMGFIIWPPKCDVIRLNSNSQCEILQSSLEPVVERNNIPECDSMQERLLVIQSRIRQLEQMYNIFKMTPHTPSTGLVVLTDLLPTLLIHYSQTKRKHGSWTRRDRPSCRQS